jgi:hypothetical protein
MYADLLVHAHSPSLLHLCSLHPPTLPPFPASLPPSRVRWDRGVTPEEEGHREQPDGQATPDGPGHLESQGRLASGGRLGQWVCRALEDRKETQATPGRQVRRGFRVSAYKDRQGRQELRGGFRQLSTARMSPGSACPTASGRRIPCMRLGMWRAPGITTSRRRRMWAAICAGAGQGRMCSDG